MKYAAFDTSYFDRFVDENIDRELRIERHLRQQASKYDRKLIRKWSHEKQCEQN